MRGSRFTEAQIIGILQEADGGRRLRCATAIVGARPPFPFKARLSDCAALPCGGTVVTMNCWRPMYAFENLMAICHEGSRRPPGSRPADTI